jgi:hypothetical protein
MALTKISSGGRSFFLHPNKEKKMSKVAVIMLVTEEIIL